MKQLKYVLGLDLGVASIGWSVVELNKEDDPVRIVDVGARVFKSLDNDKGKLYNEVRREKRGLRRIITRRKERLRRIYSLCKKEGLYDDKKYLYQDNSGETIYEMKCRGLESKLSGHELARCLIHYAKNRGFKSNRKHVDEEKDSSKIKASINQLLKIQEQHHCTITPAMMILKQSLRKDSFKNSTDEYIYFYDRASIEKEANALLDKQMEFGLIDETFKEKYLEILLSQRDFSEGPGFAKEGVLSPYAVSFEQAFGKCKFTNEERIAKATPSFELYALLQRLIDFRYYERGNRKDKIGITTEQLNQVYNSIIQKPKKDLTYSDVVKVLGISMEKYDIVNLPSLTKKQYIKVLKEFTEKLGVTYNELSEEQHQQLNQKMNQERLKLRFAKFPVLTLLSKELGTKDIDVLDAVGTILTFAKTDKKIDEYLAKEQYQMIPQALHEKMKAISLSNNEMRGSGNVSLSLVKKLIDQFLTGKNYYEAMEVLGYNHSAFDTSFDTFPTVSQIEEKYNTIITTPNVRHVLVMLRKLYRAIETKYGKPTFVRIELAREMNKSFSERNKIAFEQLQNRVNRLSIKNKLASLCNLNDRAYFSNEDILKYELFEEQGGICMYTGTPIELKKLLTGEYEIDHILPYSLSFDDSKSNKVLVLKSANQQKRNRVPLQWLKGEEKVNFEKRVRQSKLSNTKKDKLLVREFKPTDDFSNRDFAITSFVSRVVTRVFKDLLKNDEIDSTKQFVQTSMGGHTSALRYFLGLNKYTHSLVTPDYNKQTCKDLYYKIASYNVSGNGISFEFSNAFGMKVEVSRPFLYKKNEKNTFINQNEASFFDIIQNKPYVLDKVVAELGNFSDVLNLKDSDLLVGNVDDDEWIVREELNKVLIDTKEKLNKKDRNTHFHHMIDATLIAILNNKMKVRINKHRLHTQILKERYEKQEIYDQETGEMISLDQYIENNQDKFKYVNKKLVFETPYPEFVDELVIRIFERDEMILKEKLSQLGNYKDVNLDEIKVRYPSHYYSTKVSGALHAETLFGVKENVAVGRTSVKDLTLKDLESLYDKDGGSKVIFETLTKWIKTGKKGEPLLPSGRKIKKVKLVDENTSKLMKVTQSNKSNAYAGISELARILVFTKEGEDKLYFAQIDNMRYLKYKNNDYDFDVVVWKSQGKQNSEVIKLSEISNKGYTLYQELIPGEIIQLSFKKDRPTIVCKAVGFTSGQFEVKSITGDNFDLYSNSITKKQQTITISTLKSIKKVQIDLLGNLIV